MTALTVNTWWRDDAACRGMPLEMFFGSEDTPLKKNPVEGDGRLVCQSCTVVEECLLDALRTNERNGIRGGYLGHERRNALFRLGSVEAAMQAHRDGVLVTRRGR